MKLKSITRITIVSLATLSIAGLIFQAHGKNVFSRRGYLIHGMPNRSSDQAKFSEMAKRAAAAGYNQVFHNDPGILLASVRNNPATVAAYTEGFKKWKAECEQLGIQLLPAALGQSDPVRYDLEYAEAIPVRGTPFVVIGNQANVPVDPTIVVRNAGFEILNASNENLVGQWRLTGGAPGTHAFVDQTQKRPGSSGTKSVMWKDPPNSFLTQRGIAVKPGRAYVVSVWIKTQNFVQARWLTVKVSGLTGSKNTLLSNRYSMGISQTQSWKRHEFDFNSVGNSTVEVQVVYRSKKTTTGRVWFDDLEVREVGLFEPMRRPSLPIVVKSKDGTLYAEGKDYEIQGNWDNIIDQHFSLTIPAGSQIKDGEQLLVDWYQFGDMVSTNSSASFCSNGAWDLVRNQANLICKGFGSPFGWIMKHSEWRLANWDPACASTYEMSSAAEYMGGVSRMTADILREAAGNPDIEPYVLNDNYDPYHNGKTNYYLVNGSPFGAWNFLDPKSIIINWNVHHHLASALFYAGLDSVYTALHNKRNPLNPKPVYKINVPLRQIISVNEGYVTPWLATLDSAEEMGLPSDAIPGIKFETWTNNWAGLESMAEECKAAGRWAEGLPTDIGLFSAIRGKEQDRHIGGDRKIKQDLTVSGASLRYHLSRNAWAKVVVRNLLGQQVWLHATRGNESGVHRIRLDHLGLAKGVYFADLEIQAANGLITCTTKRLAIF